MARRMNFLHYILKLDKSELLSKFYYSQKYNPSNNDWTNRIKKDMDILNINITEEDIKSHNKIKFKKLVKRKSRQAAFKFLMNIKDSHSKLDNLHYKDLKMQKYLSSNLIYKNDAQLLFKLRTRMTNFKSNFKNGSDDISCKLCPNEDRQDHILICDTIIKNIPEAVNVNYSSIFNNNTSKMIAAFKIIKKALQYRENISSP